MSCSSRSRSTVSGAVDRADVLADRAGLRAGLQGDRRHQFRPGRVRDAGGLRRRGWRSAPRACRCSAAVGVAVAGHDRCSASRSSASCCGRCSAGRSSPSSWRPSASAPCCAGCRRSRSAARRARCRCRSATADRLRARLAAADPDARRRSSRWLFLGALHLVLPEEPHGRRHARRRRQPAGGDGHGHQRRALLRAGLGDGRHRLGAGRRDLGQHAGRRRAAGAGRPQGVPGGDPGRPRLRSSARWSAG